VIDKFSLLSISFLLILNVNNVIRMKKKSNMIFILKLIFSKIKLYMVQPCLLDDKRIFALKISLLITPEYARYLKFIYLD
jgi:hypothetical protein